MEELCAGEKVVITGAMTSSSEPFLGKIGTVIRKGKGYLASKYFVQIDGTEHRKTFYRHELKKIEPRKKN